MAKKFAEQESTGYAYPHWTILPWGKEFQQLPPGVFFARTLRSPLVGGTSVLQSFDQL